MWNTSANDLSTLLWPTQKKKEMQLIRRTFILYWVKTSNPIKLKRISGHKVPAASEYHGHRKFQDDTWLDELVLWRGTTGWGLLSECCVNFLIFHTSLSLAIKPESCSPLEFVNRIRELINIQTMVFWNPSVFLHLHLKLSPMHCHPWSFSFRIRN